MCAEIIHEVQRCTVCQFHSPKARKAPIQGHVEAKAPAEMMTMDMVHMLQVDGYEYLLNVVDVYSKYGISIPLKKATSKSVIEALRDQVLVHGFGRPKYWIVDGGSEFKEVFAETVQAWGAKLHDSAPNHPQSHGAIEKYNRSLENKIAKLNSEQKDGTWMDVRAAAVESINNSVHATLSDGESALSPAEVRSVVCKETGAQFNSESQGSSAKEDVRNGETTDKPMGRDKETCQSKYGGLQEKHEEA